MEGRRDGTVLISTGIRAAFGLSWTIAKTGFQVAAWTERQALSLLRARLDSLAPPPQALPSSVEALDQRMRNLLERAVEQSTSQGRQTLFSQLLDQLTPDEARIVGALSDGSGAPLVNIQARSRTGKLAEMVLENVSSIGTMANATLPHLTPTYVGHLLALGLVELGPEDPNLKSDFEILLADTRVLRALKAAARGPLPPRVERLTLRLSVLGVDLWTSCFPGEES